MNTVLLEVENHIAVITLNRPDALNALNRELITELGETWDRINQDDDIRMGIVTGAGRAFCAGLDIKEAAQRPSGQAIEELARPVRASTGYMAMKVHKPLIAAVNGAAAGGGLGLAIACDILIAAEEAIFTSPFAARGTVNADTLTLLMRKVPYGWGAWMNLSATRIDAQTALRIGLVNEVLKRDELMDRAHEMAERIMGNSYVALLAIKEKMQQVLKGTMNEATAEEGPFTQAWRQGSEAKEGFTSFAEKRRAQFG